MKSLLCHEFYQQFGGEDRSFLSEAEMLRAQGHQVVVYTRHNHDIDLGSRVGVAARSIWNASAYTELRELIRRERPDIMHCTNLFPLISPAAYQAAHDEGVPVVQALRNYRLICPSGGLLRDGQPCESCIGKRFAWPAVQHACFHKSRLGSAVVATMLAVHNLKGTWRHIDRFYTPSHFARNIFIRAGMPANRIDVLPNFVIPDPGIGRGDGKYALFVGRLSPEKGTGVLARVARMRDIAVDVVGVGPEESSLKASPTIRLLGWQPSDAVYSLMRAAKYLVVPSICYENFPRTIVEAFACGLPVIASRLGAMAEIVRDGETGLLFEPHNADDLADKMAWAEANPDRWRQIGINALREYQTKYTPDANYRQLIDIYAGAIAAASAPVAENVLVAR